MKLNKERRIYVAVLGLGLAGLLVDRIFLTPSGASAAALAESYALPPQGAGSSADASSGLAPEVIPLAGGRGLAQRMRVENAGWQEAIADAFKASEEWMPQARAAEPGDALREDAKAFEDGHTLKGVTGPRSPIAGAWVSGKFLKVGEQLNGWTLVEVAADSAFFEKDEARAELRLPAPKVPIVTRREPSQAPEPDQPPQGEKP